jgi:hypothetical protein
MADLFFADLVREASTSVGAGPLALSGAIAGHRRFADVVPPGAHFHYAIAGVTHTGEWETGEGVLDGMGALLRSPLASSAGGAPVDFSAGLKVVALTVTADWYAAQATLAGGKADLAGADFAGPVSAPSLALGEPLAVGDGGTGGSSAADARTGLGLIIGTHVAAHDPILSALVALDGTAGIVEQTGPDALAKRAIGTGSAESLLTRGDGDARYPPASHSHAFSAVTGLQAALDGKQPLDPELSAIAGLTSAADRLPYFSGSGTAALATFTSFGRALIDDSDAGAGRITLGLGSAAVLNSGTSGAAVPLLNGANVWSSTQNVSAANAPLVVNSTNSNSAKARIQNAGADVAYWGATASYCFISYDSGVVQRFAVTNGATPEIQLNSTRVVATRRTGWAAASGTASRTGFDTATASTVQVAERLKALIDDLIAHGLIGS